MADINLKRAHRLGHQGARDAADKMMAKLSDQFGMSGDWDGNTLVFQRAGVSGKLAVTEAEIVLEVTLGFFLKAMKGGIERSVNEQLDGAIAAGVPSAKPAKPPKAAPIKEPGASAKKTAPQKK